MSPVTVFVPLLAIEGQHGLAPPVQTAEQDENELVWSMTQLSFFIAHSLFSLSNPYSPPPSQPAGTQLNYPVAAQSTTYAAGPGMSHNRSDSTQTIRPGNQRSWSGAGSTQMNLANQVCIPSHYIDHSFTIPTTTAHSCLKQIVRKEAESWTGLWAAYCGPHLQISLFRCLHHIWLAISDPPSHQRIPR